MPLVRSVVYVVDDSALKASDAEVARSEEKLQALIRQRQELLANRNAGGTFDKQVFEDQRAALVSLNAAIEAQRGALSQGETAQAQYAAGIGSESMLELLRLRTGEVSHELSDEEQIEALVKLQNEMTGGAAYTT